MDRKMIYVCVTVRAPPTLICVPSGVMITVASSLCNHTNRGKEKNYDCRNKRLLIKKREDDWLSVYVTTTLKFGKVASDVISPGWKLVFCIFFLFDIWLSNTTILRLRQSAQNGSDR